MEDREAPGDQSHASQSRQSAVSHPGISALPRYDVVLGGAGGALLPWPELEWPRRMSFPELAFSRDCVDVLEGVQPPLRRAEADPPSWRPGQLENERGDPDFHRGL